MAECDNKYSYDDPELIKRFWAKVSKDVEDQCWEWTAAKQTKGYGCVSVQGKIKLAHRVAYEISVGEIPDGKFVLHKCDNRCCVNPNHLFLGNHKDNMNDMVEKGRQAKYERNAKSKLTYEDVKAIKDLYAESRYSYRQLAQQFGVSIGYIGCIVREEYWKLPLAE